MIAENYRRKNKQNIINSSQSMQNGYFIYFCFKIHICIDIIIGYLIY